jgi:hypothetical protein
VVTERGFAGEHSRGTSFVNLVARMQSLSSLMAMRQKVHQITNTYTNTHTHSHARTYTYSHIVTRLLRAQRKQHAQLLVNLIYFRRCRTLQQPHRHGDQRSVCRHVRHFRRHKCLRRLRVIQTFLSKKKIVSLCNYMNVETENQYYTSRSGGDFVRTGEAAELWERSLKCAVACELVYCRTCVRRQVFSNEGLIDLPLRRQTSYWPYILAGRTSLGRDILIIFARCRDTASEGVRAYSNYCSNCCKREQV